MDRGRVYIQQENWRGVSCKWKLAKITITDEQAGTENQTGIKELVGTEDASTKVQADTEDQAGIEDIINDNTVEVRKSRKGRQRDLESTKSKITLIEQENIKVCTQGSNFN